MNESVELLNHGEPQPLATPLRKKHRWIKRLLWAIAILLMLLIIAFVSFRYLTAKPNNPAELLAQTIAIDANTTDNYWMQQRATGLTILGRDDLVRKMDLNSSFQPLPLETNGLQINLEFTDWRTSMAKIAADNRVVVIMEDHLLTETRELIDESLDLFKDAGFKHYAAEAIGELEFLLRWRGHANHQTGVYTADPRFGNLIRSAFDLDFSVSGYDFGPLDHDTREDYAASTLSKIVLADSNNRLLVHAGPGHLNKYETDSGDRWMAMRLWEKTNIEPATIWQMSDQIGEVEYQWFAAKIKEQLDADGSEFNQPVAWTPTLEQMQQLRAAQFTIPIVDMIVIHPPTKSLGPNSRVRISSRNKKELNGTWSQSIWPVVVCAFRKSDANSAIPLDQVMLLNGESDFQLWIPDSENDFEIRVFDTERQLESKCEVTVGPTDSE